MVSVTTDIWTNQNMDSYITVTVHFYLESNLKSFVLTTSDLATAHTSENLVEIFTGIITEWKLNGKITAIVRDNGTTIVKRCELLGLRHMHCFAHMLNLAIRDSVQLAQVDQIISKCKRIVKFFKKSSAGWRVLKLEQQE